MDLNSLIANLSVEFQDLIPQLLEVNAVQRIGVNQLKVHAWWLLMNGDKTIGTMNQYELLLHRFVLDRVLHNEIDKKLLFLLGTIGKEACIVILEKLPFDNDANMLKTIKFQSNMVNDKYTMGNCTFSIKESTGLVNIIYPANAKDIAKYSFESQVLIRETALIYKEHVLSQIQAIPSAHLNWVQNILDGKAEVERTLHVDDQFLLGKNMLWDGIKIDTLYCLAFPKIKIASMRDLNASHIPLLKHIMQQTAQVILEKYQVPQNQLRFYFHYPPSFYWLHIHVSHIKVMTSVETERAHLLQQVF